MNRVRASVVSCVSTTLLSFVTLLLGLLGRLAGPLSPAVEPLDPVTSGERSLAACIGRVAARADLDDDLVAGRARHEGRSAGAAANGRRKQGWMLRQGSSSSVMTPAVHGYADLCRCRPRPP